MFSCTVGPACFSSGWGFIEKGICSCCENPATSTRHWIKVTEFDFFPLCFCRVCVANKNDAVKIMTAKERVDLVDAEFAKEAAELEFGKQLMKTSLERIRNGKASQLTAKGGLP